MEHTKSMDWEICLLLSIIFFIVIIIVGVIIWRRRKKTRNISSLISVFIVATYFSLQILFYPVCRESLVPGSSWAEAWFLSFIKPLQVFVLNEDYNTFFGAVTQLAAKLPEVGVIYQVWGTIIHFLAPISLAGFIVTLFQRIRNWWKLHTSGSKNIYLFSELNKRSLILARSCVDHEVQENGKEPLIIFTSVREQSEDESSDLIGQAKAMGALCMKDGILDLHVRFEKKRAKEIWFFILGSDETKNTGYALSLIDRYKKCKKIKLYVLSDSVDSELMIGSAMDEDTKMDIRRINEEQSMVYSYLYDTKDNCLFRHLSESPDGKKILSIVLVGLGKLGTEFLRALVWYWQMPEVRLQIYVFEKDPLAEEKFTSLCPELMEKNHNYIDGDSQYDIWFRHSTTGEGIDAETIDFDYEILELSEASIAYVLLGDDAKNINIAIKLRRLFAQKNMNKVMIQAAVFDPERNKQKEGHDFNKYDIDFIGNIKTEWSYHNVVMSELDEFARRTHLHWEKVEENNDKERLKSIRAFYQDEYNRRSSMASVIRAKVRNELPDLLPGANKKWKELSEEEKLKIARWEHIGWNAYMRSEGYQCAEKRDNIAKYHKDLIPFDELEPKEKEKDCINWKDIESNWKEDTETEPQSKEQINSDEQIG